MAIISDFGFVNCIFIVLIVCCATIVSGDEVNAKTKNAKHLVQPQHHPLNIDDPILDEAAPPETGAKFWRQNAQSILRQHLHVQPNTNVAKNVIFFLGDGMSVPTIVAARTLFGQLQGKSGEESQLSFEQFPYVGLSKTYCVDRQTADSACSATAYLTGVKANFMTIGVTADVQINDCAASMLPQNRLSSLLAWAQHKGKRTGVVTNTRITHASPTGAYAHTAHRNWESDADIPEQIYQEAPQCPDIASQLVLGETGRNLNVIFGGGRKKFLPANLTDAEGVSGERRDGVNLIDMWLDLQRSTPSVYLQNRQELLAAQANRAIGPDYVLGLFAGDHLKYNLEANRENEPSVAEMTVAAINLLEKGSNGYVLFVESGRIDHAHHENKARKALYETIEFSEAIRQASELINLDETLIVVTADHAHTMSLSGYSKRGKDILGLNTELGDDHLPYSTISYGTGPRHAIMTNGSRSNLAQDLMEDTNYVYPALVPMSSAAHGGDDVGVFAIGPWSHLFTGVYEQNAIPHMIGFAACIGDELTVCGLRNEI